MIICDNEQFKEAAEFYATKLGIPDSTIIAVGVYPEMPVAGYCGEYHDDDVYPYFIVGIEDNDLESGGEDPLAVLAHEMVHVKQYVNGELVDHGKYCSWHGKKYEETELSSEEYFFSPWEVEAFGMQVGLYRMYCRSIEE
jgi:hypothetical protein